MKPLPPEGAVHTHPQIWRKARLRGWTWKRIAQWEWECWRNRWTPICRAKGEARWLVGYMLDVHGITESDVRDYMRYINMDRIRVRLWNWRTFDVDGLEVYRYMRRHTDMNAEFAIAQ